MSMPGRAFCNEINFTYGVSSKSIFSFETEAIITPRVTQRTV